MTDGFELLVAAIGNLRREKISPDIIQRI